MGGEHQEIGSIHFADPEESETRNDIVLNFARIITALKKGASGTEFSYEDLMYGKSKLILGTSERMGVSVERIVTPGNESQRRELVAETGISDYDSRVSFDINPGLGMGTEACERIAVSLTGKVADQLEQVSIEAQEKKTLEKGFLDVLAKIDGEIDEFNLGDDEFKVNLFEIAPGSKLVVVNKLSDVEDEYYFDGAVPVSGILGGDAPYFEVDGRFLKEAKDALQLLTDYVRAEGRGDE